jgi:hypothetical protein
VAFCPRAFLCCGSAAIYSTTRRPRRIQEVSALPGPSAVQKLCFLSKNWLFVPLLLLDTPVHSALMPVFPRTRPFVLLSAIANGPLRCEVDHYPLAPFAQNAVPLVSPVVLSK